MVFIPPIVEQMIIWRKSVISIILRD